MRSPYRAITRAIMSNVPTISSVRPGAAVSIVLKQDQPTGRQVQGIVQDLLTRGNHPRGIKVRLTDGRVGRVQRMGGGGEAGPAATSGSVGSAGVEGGSAAEDLGNGFQRRGRNEQRLRYRDVRLDDQPEEPEASYDLAAFIKVAKPKRGGAKGGAAKMTRASSVPPEKTVTAKCPVCGAFEGDEAAVAHHVESHFE